MIQRIAKLMLPVAVATLVLGCATNKPTNPDDPATKELSAALKQSAERAVEVRVAMAKMQPAQEAVISGEKRVSTSLIDIDFTGPVDRALKIVTSSLGWEMKVRGKKRGDPMVSLRHDNVDSLVVLRDIGAQCAEKCDVAVDLVEGGHSTVTLIYKR